VTLSQPGWLILLIPLAAAMWYWRLPSPGLRVLRAVVLGLVLLALAGAAVRLPSRAGTVVVVADRSASMPTEAARAQAEAVGLLDDARGAGDRLAVVSFGRRAVVEAAPEGEGFSDFVGDADPDASALASALRTGLGLIPPESPGRLLVLSDGRYTGADPWAAAARAGARGIGIDYRAMVRPAAGDLAIARIDAPLSLAPEEAFLMHAWVRVPVRRTVRYELRRGGTTVLAGEKTVDSGTTCLAFRDRAGEAGTRAYTLHVQGGPDDPVPENNRARWLVTARGRKPVLVVTPSEESGLARLLAGGGIHVEPRTPGECRWRLEDLARYAAVLIENTPAGDVGTDGMTHLAAWVKQAGGGLMMTGGKGAYGPGGYFRSPLEPVLPVSMELRKEHRKLALAIVVALDRSGSMAMTVPGGRTKMDLANLAAGEVVGLLSGLDEFGCVAVDSSAHIVAPLAPVRHKESIRGRIRQIGAMGGGIFVYEALSTAAGMLTKAKASTRHIILFADAADSEEPGDYKALLTKCRQADITVSVIGLGSVSDVDAGLLKDIASRGGGRCLFTRKPHELPRLFAQDTFVVARSTFLDEPTPVRATGGMASLTGRAFPDMPAVGGYNLCYLRPGANLAAVTLDEYEAPLVAAWSAGTGRALCYTGDADGQYAGPLAAWDDVGHFFTSLVRWTAGRSRGLPRNMLITQEMGDATCTVTLHLDPDRASLPFDGLPTVRTLRGRPGRPPRSSRQAMAWASPDALRADVPLGGRETVLPSVEVPGVGRRTLPPVCAPYSAEFKPADLRRGRETLQRLARATGGTQRVDLAGVWEALPALPRRVALAPWLLMGAVALFLVEVLERRTGVLAAALGSVRFRRKAKAREAEETKEAAPSAARKPARRRGRRTRRPEKESAERGADAAQPPTDLGETLRKARRRAEDRTRPPPP